MMERVGFRPVPSWERPTVGETGCPEPADAEGQPWPGGVRALLVGSAGLVVLGGLIWWVVSGPGDSERIRAVEPRAVGEGVTAGFIGDRSCRECHPGESAAHSRSGHSRTLRKASAVPDLVRWLDGRSVDDPERPGVRWAYSVRQGRLTAERTEGGKSHPVSLDYAFGSGHHATTFMTVTGKGPGRQVFLESRLSYYARPERLDITPGQRAESIEGHVTPDGAVSSEAGGTKCFYCHSTLLSTENPAELDLGAIVPNVRCERCHGPARAHVAEARGGAAITPMPLGPGRMTALAEMTFCGECHRLPDQLPPGIIRRDNAELVRFQPVGLMQSRCYTGSAGALSCTNCHDPHMRTSTDRPSYETVCLSCHDADGPGRPPCPVSPRTGCLDCHMPRRDTGQKIEFTDHWIRVNRWLRPRGPAAESPGLPVKPAQE